jgi:Transcriptional regulator
MNSMESLINRPRTKRGRTTLNNILNAAAQVIYEKGYHESSIKDITSRAGVASGTFYVYFEGKYQLYKYLLLQCSHMIRKHLNQSTRHCTTRREKERTGMRVWLDFLVKNQFIFHIVWEALYVDKQLFMDYYGSFCVAYVRGLNADKETGEVRDIDSEVLAYMLMGATNFFGLNWTLFKENGYTEIDMVVNEFMKIMDGGIFNSDFAPPAQIETFRFAAFVEDDSDEYEDEMEPGEFLLQ